MIAKEVHGFIQAGTFHLFTNGRLLSRETLWKICRSSMRSNWSLLLNLFATSLTRYSEETIIVNRVIREDPTKSGMHNRQPVTPKLLWKSMKDYDLWPIYIIGLLFQIPETTPAQYLTLTLKGIGFDTLHTNLLVIPSTVFHIITMLALTYIAEIGDELTLTALIGQIWVLPFVIYIYLVDITKINKWKAFGIMSLLISYPSGRYSPPLTLIRPHRYITLTKLQHIQSKSPGALGTQTPCVHALSRQPSTICLFKRPVLLHQTSTVRTMRRAISAETGLWLQLLS
jgi:hypothetical protein